MTIDVPREERANLWALCAAQFLTLGGMTAVLPLVPLYLQQIGISDPAAVKYWTGAIGSAPFAVAVFATPIWGALADRFGHKPMVVRSVFGLAGATLGMGAAATPLALLGWRGVQGAVSGVFPAAVALVAALTPPARLSRSLAMLQSARAAGALCGPLIGGLLADLVGIRGLFFGVGAIAAVTAVVCSVVIREPSEASRHQQREADATGWRDLLGQPAVFGMLVLLALFQAAAMCPWPTLALFVEHLGVERAAIASTTGILIFAAGLPATVAATAWARFGQRARIENALVLALLLTGIANVAVGLTSRLGIIFALRALAGLSMAGFVPLAFEWMNAHSPPTARGRTAGLGSTAMMIGNVVGPLAGGWLAVHVGIASTFWASGALITVVATAIGVRLLVTAAVGRPRPFT